MMKPTIDELIARSAPPTGAESLRVQAMIRAVAEESRAAVKSSPRSPRPAPVVACCSAFGGSCNRIRYDRRDGAAHGS